MEVSDAVSIRSTCRSCGSNKLIFILSLGDQYVSNFVDSGPLDEYPHAPLELVLCDSSSGGCGLVQLRHTVSPELMFRQYWYKSMVNESMRMALADICRSAESRAELKAGDLVIDIGCNDGTLLRSYSVTGLKRVGFEPAKNLQKDARVGTTKIINDFFNHQAFSSHFPDETAKVVTSIAMFYDLENPNEFVQDILKCLAPDGLWVIQMSYLPSMLEQNAFDNICHEHLEYYSLMAIEHLLKKHGLRVVDVELNDVNGGSFRLYVSRAQGGRSWTEGTKRVKELEERERVLGLHKRDVYEAFARRVQELKTKLVTFINQESRAGKKVYVYGASTKGNTLLQYYGLDSSTLLAAAERNSDKWGKLTIGSMIPIVSEAQARKDAPDYMLVLPWHFLDGFVSREREYLQNGGKFVVPLPEFKIIGSES